MCYADRADRRRLDPRALRFLRAGGALPVIHNVVGAGTDSPSSTRHFARGWSGSDRSRHSRLRGLRPSCSPRPHGRWQPSLAVAVIGAPARARPRGDAGLRIEASTAARGSTCSPSAEAAPRPVSSSITGWVQSARCAPAMMCSSCASPRWCAAWMINCNTRPMPARSYARPVAGRGTWSRRRAQTACRASAVRRTSKCAPPGAAGLCKLARHHGQGDIARIDHRNHGDHRPSRKLSSETYRHRRLESSSSPARSTLPFKLFVMEPRIVMH